jgi:hypothetical protein
MNVILTAIILLSVEQLCFYWGSAFIELDMFNLYTNMLTFLIVDMLTIRLIYITHVPNLTKWIHLLLVASIINHVCGAVSWVTYNDAGLAMYDNAKTVIFNLELLAFMCYGIYRGGKRIRALAATRRTDGASNI